MTVRWPSRSPRHQEVEAHTHLPVEFSPVKRKKNAPRRYSRVPFSGRIPAGLGRSIGLPAPCRSSRSAMRNHTNVLQAGLRFDGKTVDIKGKVQEALSQTQRRRVTFDIR